MSLVVEPVVTTNKKPVVRRGPVVVPPVELGAALVETTAPFAQDNAASTRNQYWQNAP